MAASKTLVNLKIITVDDSPVIANRLKLLLCDIQEVEWLGNAECIPNALAAIEETRPHVVILDIHLSHDKPKNGIDLLFQLKKTYPEMKVIMLTNLSDEKYREMCSSYGADYFFDKSNDFDKIPGTLSLIRDGVF